MRVCERNKQTAYYQLYEGKTPKTNSDGKLTGRSTETYGEKTEFRVHIRMGSERTHLEPYGTNDETGLTLYMEKDLGFDTNTVLWIGETDKPNYRVTAVAKNINGIVVKAKLR